MRRDPSRSTPVLLAIVAIAGALVYSNTLGAPFHFDDFGYIKENPLVRDLGNFIDTSGAGPHLPKNVATHLHTRYVGFLTFALNFRLGGLDPQGYRAFNIALHAVNAMLLYALVLAAFRSPGLRGSRLRAHCREVAFFCSLFLVCHPVETGAVTYISQRFASLSASFYLFSVLAYALSRLSGGRRQGITLYACSLASAALAMKTKETAFTLPPVLALFELVFFGVRGEARGRRLLRLAPFVLAMAIIPLSLVKPGAGFFEAVSDATRTSQDLSRHDYLATEFRVAATYLRLLFLPINQNLDYDYPVYASFLDPPVYLSFALLALPASAAAFMLYRSGRGDGGLRLPAFGICWFFIALLVESSIIPLEDVIYEHRLYLPSAGAFAAVVCGVYLLGEGRGGRRAAPAFLLLISILFSAAAYHRNLVWGDGLTLWQDVAQKAPLKARGHNNLGNRYREMGMYGEALAQYLVSVRLDPDNAAFRDNLGMAYALMGQTDTAIAQFLAALGIDPYLAEAHNNLGYAYMARGDLEKAVRHLNTALLLNPGYVTARRNLEDAYRSMASGKGKDPLPPR